MTKLTCDLAPWRTWQARALKENLTQTPPQNFETTTEGDFRRSQNCAALFLSLKSGVIVETKPTLLCCVVGRGVRVGWCSLNRRLRSNPVLAINRLPTRYFSEIGSVPFGAARSRPATRYINIRERSVVRIHSVA
jgi:hypothetical protein